jgi:acyl-CoA thioester hydrolase
MSEQQPPQEEKPPLFRFSHGHRVRYEEVDAQGIVGAASWFNILQLGRTEYLRYIGLMLEGSGRLPIQLVVRRASIEYLAAARFDDPLVIRVRTSYLGARSARLEYVVDDIETGLRPVLAETLVVCVEQQTLRSVPWPQVLRQRIQELEGDNLQLGQR